MYVYFVQASHTKLIKIGRTNDVYKRIRSLRTVVPDNVKLLGCVQEQTYTESSIHKMFATEREHGEWFRPSQRILKFIKEKAIVQDASETNKAWLPKSGTRLRTPGAIGNLILGHRKALGITQEDFAEMLGTSRQWVISLESGHPRAELGLVLRALNAFNIPMGIVDKAVAKPSLIDEILNRCKQRGKIDG